MNTKCPYCDYTTVISYGKKCGRQRFKCKNPKCARTWTRQSQSKIKDKIWQDFAVVGIRIQFLVEKYGKNEKTIRNYLKEYAQVELKQMPPKTVKSVIMDATYFGRNFGQLVVIEALTGQPLYCQRLDKSETVADYKHALTVLSKQGYMYIQAVTIDGRTGVAAMIKSCYGLLVQKCQKHQKDAAARNLSRHPALVPNQELMMIVNAIFHSKRDTIALALSLWHVKYLDWLQEKTTLENGHKQFTHKKTRTVYNSLKRNLHDLFTFQDYFEIYIPNTTGKLDGKFGNIKPIIKIHRGMLKDLLSKIFLKILSGSQAR